MSAPAVEAQTIAGAAVPGRAGACEIRIEDGRIAAIVDAPQEASLLALPAFEEPHLHADRAFTFSGARPGSLADAIDAACELRRRQRPDRVCRRAERLFRLAVRHGVVRARTHVDVDRDVELRAIEGVGAARRACAVDVEIVAFATDRLDPARTEGRALLADALAAGADLLGGAPARYGDPPASIEALLDLAAEHDVGLDLHLDESTTGEGALLERLAAATAHHGLAGRVSASHCCELAALPPAAAVRTIDRVAAAEITVIVLPALNLYLQDRGPGTPRLRGLTLVRELAAAGVPVRFGSDNVQDDFHPYGSADPLESAFLASLAGHVDDEETLIAGICGGRSGIGVGDRAELVLIEAGSLREALADRTRPRRLVA